MLEAKGAGSEASLAGDPRRFAALDGWRGVCALMVVLLHAPVVSALTETGLVRNAFLFVDFFFVLSGFVIAHSTTARLRADRDFLGFFAARVARVYPLHLFMLALFVAFELLLLVVRGPTGAFQGGNSPGALVHNLLMTHSLGFVEGLGWNYPSWSISAELVAYLVFAVLALTLARVLPLALLVIAAASAAVVAVNVGHLDTTIAYGWLRCLFGFSLGAFLRLVIWPRAEIAGPSRGRWTTLELATVAAVAIFVPAAGTTSLALLAPLVFTAAIYVFAHEAGAVSSLLKRRPFGFLGLVSYSIYMTHAFVISRMINAGSVGEALLGRPLYTELPDGGLVLAQGELAGALALLAIVVGTILFSAITWRLVERPGQRLTLRALRRIRAGHAGAARAA